MKNPISSMHLILMALLCMGVSSLQAQKGDAILSNFSGFEVEGIVYISVTIASGNTCNGIDVFKSEDDFHYTRIGNISGICGSASHPVSYEFVDSLPNLNGINYYQLELGGQGLSSSIEVEVRTFSNNKIQIYPNPSTDGVMLHFQNPENHLLEVYFYNARGVMVYRHSTNTNQLNHEVSSWPHGMYWIKVFNQENEQEQSGVFIKN